MTFPLKEHVAKQLEVDTFKSKVFLKAPLRAIKRLLRNFIAKRTIGNRRRQLLRGIRQPWVPAVYLETTSACNLNCVMCPCQRPAVKLIKPDGFMKLDLFRELVDQVGRRNPVPRVYLHKDGEPLLHPEIVDMIRFASDRLPHVTLVTNATLLDEKMASAILGTNLQEIRFSLEGSNNQTYAKIRRQPPDNPHRRAHVSVSYESVVENITRFCEMKKARAMEKPRVGIRTTAFKPTLEEVEATVDFWNERVDYVRVVPLLSWSGTVNVHEKTVSPRHPCMHLWESQVISSDGTAVPCCIYVDKTGSKQGHLADLNSQDLNQAFMSQDINKLRMAHLSGQTERYEFCRACLDWDDGNAETKAVWSRRFKRKMKKQIERYGSVR